MKKFMILFVTGIILSFPVYPQFVSEGFENWEDGNPVNWYSSNIPPVYIPVTQTNDAHSGSFAVRGEIIPTQQGTGYPPLLSAGTDVSGFPINFRPQTISGWYKFHSDTGDAFIVSAALIKDGHAIGSAGFYTNENTSEYKQFSSVINYLSSEVPDTIQIVIVISNTQILPGANYVLDDLSLEGVTGVSDIEQKMEYALDQNFPNPFNPVTTIHFSIPAEEFVSLKVYDSVGREVRRLLNQAMDSGDHSLSFDAENLPTGVYIYKLQAGKFIQSRKMLVLK